VYYVWPQHTARAVPRPSIHHLKVSFSCMVSVLRRLDWTIPFKIIMRRYGSPKIKYFSRWVNYFVVIEILHRALKYNFINICPYFNPLVRGETSICTFYFVPISRLIFVCLEVTWLELNIRFELVRIFATLYTFVNCLYTRPLVSPLSKPPMHAPMASL